MCGTFLRTVQKAVYTILPKRNKDDLLIRLFIARCSPHSLKISVRNDDIKDLRFFLSFFLRLHIPVQYRNESYVTFHAHRIHLAQYVFSL